MDFLDAYGVIAYPIDAVPAIAGVSSHASVRSNPCARINGTRARTPDDF